MVRLTRSEQQARTRSAVLAAARDEFGEHGYTDAKVDRIAERADLTRGAVYSNFAGKRQLYLAVLLEAASHLRAPTLSPSGHLFPGDLPSADLPFAGLPFAGPSLAGPAEVAESVARAWLDRLPLAGDTAAGARLRSASLAGVFDDEPGRTASAELTRLEALLLALALERAGSAPGRRVRLAELILALLHGAAELARSAPGFGDPFDVVRACRHLTAIDLPDSWDPPHLAFVEPAQPSGETWTAPTGLTDELTGRAADLRADGLVVVLGSGRLSAAEEAVRAARPGDTITVAAVTGDPAETGALVRLRLTILLSCLTGPRARPPGERAADVRPAAVPPAGPTLPVVVPPGGPAVPAGDRWFQLVLDDRGEVAAVVCAEPGDGTEVAVRVRGGVIVARASGRGAGHAVAVAS